MTIHSSILALEFQWTEGISGYRHKNAKCSYPPLKMTLNLKVLNSSVLGFFLISVSVVSKCINVLCVCVCLGVHTMNSSLELPPLKIFVLNEKMV